MSLAQMKVFNDYVMPATYETLANNVAAFNAASGGTIILTADGFVGDFKQESFWNSIHAAQRRVDRYAAQAAVTPTDLTQSDRTRVKVAGGFGPIRFEPGQLSWLNKPTAEAIEIASRQFAEILLLDQLNTGLRAAVGAIGNQPTIVRDISATASPNGGISHIALNEADALFGDASSALLTRFMTGAAYHKLIGRNLTNSQNLFDSKGVRVVDLLGKPAVVLDAPALYVAGSPNKFRVLTLTSGGVEITDNSDVITNIQTVNGQTRIETTIQGDYTFTVGVKGYSWDVLNGGKSPDDAKLSTGSNWDKTVNSDKHQAGTLLICSADQ